MPFYEYECASCKFYTEVMQKISDPPLVKCPSCGKKALKKLVSAPVFRLKGGGWYETDFKSDKEGKRNLADRAEPPSEDAKVAKPVDPKPGDAKAAATSPAGASTESSGKSASEGKRDSGGDGKSGTGAKGGGESKSQSGSEGRSAGRERRSDGGGRDPDRASSSSAKAAGRTAKPAAKPAVRPAARGKGKGPARKKGRR